MKERILQFLRSENKTSSQLAEEIGVQPSSISHIISGRNKPSLDFVLKMLETYRDMETEWLLFGRGEIYKNQIIDQLFDDNSVSGNKRSESKPSIESKNGLSVDYTDIRSEKAVENSFHNSGDENKPVSKVIILYSDNSFSEYNKS